MLALAAERVRTFDRPLVLVAGGLICAGVLIALATSPGVSSELAGEAAFYFAMRQAGYAIVGVIVALACAQANARTVRRIGAVLFAIALPACALVALFAPEVRGAARWVALGPVSLQPSEILKPAIVIVWAWMLSEGMRDRNFPGWRIAIGLYALAAFALLAQPDVGQTALLALVLGPMLLMSGVRLRWLLLGLVLAVVAGWLAYQFYPHVRERWHGFVDPSSDAGYQTGRALDAIASGGVFGRGPGEGVVKRTLPDAHADFVFAVAAEEFGLLASLGLIAAFGVLAFRGFSRAARLVDPFEQLAAAGLTTLFVAQASIHIAVNLSLLPAKGMTLPFVSYGGSSMLGASLALGFLLALTRRRPGAYVFEGRAP